MVAYKRTPAKRSIKRPLIIAAGALLVLAGGAVLAYRYTHRNTSQRADGNGQTINYAPATQNEKKEAEDNKDRIVEEQKKQEPNTGTDQTGQKKTVTPVISSATPTSVSAYITGIFEENGTCTATFTNGSTSKTKTSAGFENASYTQCAPIKIEAGFLTPGKWTVVVSYSSNTASGQSAADSIEVK